MRINKITEQEIDGKRQKSHTDYLRDGVRQYMADHDMTAQEFAEKADISFNTLQSILYKTAGCHLETAIAISKAIGIGLDELANTGLLPDEMLVSIKKTRTLPLYRRKLVRRYINWQSLLEEQSSHTRTKIIDVMNLDYVNDHLHTTDDLEPVDISDFPDDIKATVFRGMRIPCAEYIQFYRENDILLLSAERPPRLRERCVILYFDRVFIVQRDIKNGVPGYRGIRDAEIFVPEKEIDYYFGYVVAVKHE